MPLLGTTGDVISAIVGWVYFFAWSISFYPQIYTNWKRKSVVGLSFDYVTYNIIGFVCYSIFNASFYWIPSIQEDYKKQHDGKENLVAGNDVAFGIHAVFATIIIIVQIFLYEKGPQKVSKICIGLSTSGCISIALVLILTLTKVTNWLFFLYYLSMVKLAITFIKYCPQVYLNFKRKSTVGWNIWNVLLDFTGGLLSAGQLVFDAWRKDSWSGVIGDPVKFGLGFLSMAFDIIFMIQHYVLYKNSAPPEYQRVEEEHEIATSSRLSGNFVTGPSPKVVNTVL